MSSMSKSSLRKLLTVGVAIVTFLAWSKWKLTNRSGDDENQSLATFKPPLLVEIQKYAAVFPHSHDDSKATLNVHVVAHTHDDVGWLKTVEQYYYGLNQSIQHVCVDDILTTVVEALLENPHRTFTYVEQKFFSMWWARQSDPVKDSVRDLVRQKRLTFVNGGWCMHDEATTHFMGMIDQTTLGHDFLKQELNVIPKVGWQLDPFGHSATQASLMTYRMGFDALYFGRIDYQDLSKRHADRECEGLWNASSSWKDSAVFWGLTGSYEGNYGPPTGFCFDIHCDNDYHPILNMNRTALLRAVEDFLMQVRQQSDRTKGNHIMLTMGSDFQYQRAAINFANTDYLIGTIMHLQQWGKKEDLDIASMFGPRFDKVNIFYSSPDYYTECKYNETISAMASMRERNEMFADTTSLRSLSSTNNTSLSMPKSDTVSWTVKQDDFFPYSDCPHCFWTGYFTSRPALKKLERVSSSFLMAARQIEALLDHSSNNSDVAKIPWEAPMHQLEDASGVIQHHDGVSGTSKQHVGYDYAKRVQAGINAVTPLVIEKLKRELLGANPMDYLKNLSYCQLLNETRCDVATSATRSDDLVLYVVVYNSLAQERDAFVQLPVASAGHYQVMQHDSPTNLQSVLALPVANKNSTFLLHFKAANLPPIGARVFKITKSLSKLPSPYMQHTNTILKPPLMSVSSNQIIATINTLTGQIVQLGSKAVENLTTWGYYTSFDWTQDRIQDNDHQNSGAYIFRPSTPNQKLQIVQAVKGHIVNTITGIEVHTTYAEPWIKTTTRILNDAPYIEIDYQVGPIPTGDGRGKEVVVRYNTMVSNQATFYTDSNGREFVKRERNSRPLWDLTVYEPIAGNYYPVNAAIYVEDSDTAFAVVADRSQGGASISDGTLELMVHRRTLVDDWRGVDEAINETDIGITPNPPWGNATRLGEGIVVRGTHRILVPSVSGAEGDDGPKISGAALARSAMDDSFAEPLVFVASAKSTAEIPFRAMSFSGLQQSLPKNVMLVTKQLLCKEATTTYLVRLGHQYGVGEDPKLSLPVDVSLDSLFPGQSIANVHETTLSGNQDISNWNQLRMKWTGPSLGSIDEVRSDIANTITLHPMDIRTFKVTVDLSKAGSSKRR